MKEFGFELCFLPFETERLREVLHSPGNWGAKAAALVEACWHRLREVPRELERADAVLVYREAALIGPPLIEKWIARKGIPIIYQLDDPLYIPYRSPHSGYFSYLKFFNKVAELCRVSTTVIANSTAHVEYARQFNNSVVYIPSLVDTSQYSYQPKRSESVRCVGWSGSATTAGNLGLVRDALDRVKAPHRVHLIGGSYPLEGQVTSQAWNAATEVEDLRQFDIGLVPLPDNPWNRRKFNLKVAQYMALGIPPIATPLGDNPRLIQHGRTGFLAETTADWSEAIELLLRDDELRLTMSQTCAQVAKAEFSLDAYVPRIARVFADALSGSVPKSAA